ncbi:MAG: hypothetical protein HC821_01815 [Lewinella sp.]|nr:hypothetical protein [Lewinella sp.]
MKPTLWASLFLLLGLFWLLPLGVAAQEMRTLSDGTRIVVYSDGSARYFHNNALVPDFSGSDSAATYPVFFAKIEPLSAAVNITEDDLKRIANRQLELAREAATLAEERALAAKVNQELLADKLSQAKGQSTPNVLTDDRLDRQWQLAQKIALEAQQELQKAQLQLRQAQQVLAQNRYVEAYNLSRLLRRQRSERGSGSDAELPHAKRLLGQAAAGFTGYGNPITQNPALPYQPCTIAYEGTEPESGQFVRASAPELFFTHTDESLRPYLQGREYLTAKAFVHSKTGYRYLTIQISFANPNALQTYGYLEQGSLLSLHLLDGNYVNLRSLKTANGSWNEKRGELTYEVTYVLDRGILGILKNSELDYLQLFWSSGFEEYEVYQVDLLQRLMNCL